MSNLKLFTEKFWIWIAWRLPRELVSHVFARVVAYSTWKHQDKTPSDINTMDALHDWIYDAAGNALGRYDKQ